MCRLIANSRQFGRDVFRLCKQTAAPGRYVPTSLWHEALVTSTGHLRKPRDFPYGRMTLDRLSCIDLRYLSKPRLELLQAYTWQHLLCAECRECLEIGECGLICPAGCGGILLPAALGLPGVSLRGLSRIWPRRCIHAVR